MTATIFHRDPRNGLYCVGDKPLQPGDTFELFINGTWATFTLHRGAFDDYVSTVAQDLVGCNARMATE